MTRIPVQVELATWLAQSGRMVEGTRVLEVGAGHLAIVPIGLLISGALTIPSIAGKRGLTTLASRCRSS